MRCDGEREAVSLGCHRSISGALVEADSLDTQHPYAELDSCVDGCVGWIAHAKNQARTIFRRLQGVELNLSRFDQ